MSFEIYRWIWNVTETIAAATYSYIDSINLVTNALFYLKLIIALVELSLLEGGNLKGDSSYSYCNLTGNITAGDTLIGHIH